ncbi:TetR/AcrR family transcriptional regulator [Acetobacter sp. TBRC 12305]|uniref:TetR/AcrR family transcriptional regulator n=1 Tax=Acetobacter garciniae TaxID=2817435 RepID=A0A939HQE7_9PROT|nr:TetR/AcrR family transcriptional regulator [Acetobacter garciniae]MBO1325546.1 TetR/AcrR family transcriptional regulator [Acetobacter garciniae]MBX0345282.1 TetR/AcrR family transcriptional regulator [Acetobacter garciniae]
MKQKSAPQQDRSRQTYETLLLAAGELLAEVGLEQFSTNRVCLHAQVTPPALYRYFPNKYALLVAMGERLMEAQDEALFAWIEQGGLEATSTDEVHEKFCTLIREMVRITQSHAGGIWIIRAMRATPVLRQVRVNSRERVVDRLMQVVKVGLDDNQLRIALRLDVELVTAAIEWLIEEPESDSERIIHELSWNRYSFFEKLRERAAQCDMVRQDAS